VSQIIKGLREKFLEDLHQGVGKATRWLGKVGYPSKGVALSIVGVLFGWAALTYDPQKAGGMDAALTTIRNQPFGTVLLVIMAAGQSKWRQPRGPLVASSIGGSKSDSSG
jgi:Domain of Unknown Function (DUF1206)